MSHKINWKWVALSWASLILLLSVIPGQDLPTITFWEIDKIVHTIFYFVLSFTSIIAIKQQYPRVPLRFNAIIYGVGLCILYGLCIEIVQGAFLESRSFDLYDLVANFIGCVLGVIGILVIFKRS
ncbi:MAG TPA: VanZ family protein [Chitinophagales bacterium]|nr:VanZ family protein [Chitinophagales bacterium]